MSGSITDVGGIRVGHHHRIDPDAQLGSGWATGTTVVLTPPGTVGAVDGRGGAPGTRETDLLDPSNSVRHVDAVVLTGGSAYGLAAADGVMNWLEPHGRGVALDGGVVLMTPSSDGCHAHHHRARPWSDPGARTGVARGCHLVASRRARV